MEDKFINYLKKTEIYNEELLNYLKDNTKVIEYSEDANDFIGTFPQVDENNILTGIKMCVPKMTNDITVGMNIHEYVHALMLYRNLNKEYVEDNQAELMPTFYELNYYKENNVNDYFNFYIEHIKEKGNYLTMLLNIFDKDNNKNNINHK